jgi:hypothetical protein
MLREVKENKQYYESYFSLASAYAYLELTTVTPSVESTQLSKYKA